MTKDEMFFKVVTHLVKQGHRALGDRRCRYLTPNGDKCAIGCLIKDEDYSEDFEKQSVGSLLDPCDPLLKDPELIALYKENGELMNSLQDLHDTYFDSGITSYFQDRVIFLAEEYDIDSKYVPPIKIAYRHNCLRCS
jgi:hypothetical protein